MALNQSFGINNGTYAGDGDTVAGDITQIATLVTDMATLVADGATPTQAHVTAVNTDWSVVKNAMAFDLVLLVDTSKFTSWQNLQPQLRDLLASLQGVLGA